MLKSVKHPGIRGPNTKLDILFHVADPMGIRGLHGSHEDPYIIMRKPHIIVTSLNAAKRAAGRETDAETWNSVINTYAPNKPYRPFIWPDILSAEELKFIQVMEMPSDYSPARNHPAPV